MGRWKMRLKEENDPLSRTVCSKHLTGKLVCFDFRVLCIAGHRPRALAMAQHLYSIEAGRLCIVIEVYNEDYRP